MEAPDYSERSPLFPNPLVCARDMAKTASSEVCSYETNAIFMMHQLAAIILFGRTGVAQLDLGVASEN